MFLRGDRVQQDDQSSDGKDPQEPSLATKGVYGGSSDQEQKVPKTRDGTRHHDQWWNQYDI